jgi:hypothetical protein
MQKELILFRVPIPILACSDTPELDFQRKDSVGYLFASKSASMSTSPAPSLGILVRTAGLL